MARPDPMAVLRIVITAVVAVTIAGTALLVRSNRTDAFAHPKLYLALVMVSLGAALTIIVLGLAPSIIVVPTDLAILGWIGWTLLSWTRSIDPDSGWLGQYPEYQGVAAVVVYALMFFIAGFGSHRLVVLGPVVAAVGTLVASYALLQSAGVDPVWGDGLLERSFSTLGLPTSAGAYLVMTVPLTIGLAFCLPMGPRLLLGGAAAIQVFGVLATQSRGALLGLVVAAVVLTYRGFHQRLRPIAVVAGVALVVLLVGPGRGLVEANIGRAVSEGAELSNSQHLSLWLVGAEATVQHPMFGAGPDTFPDAYALYAADVLSDGQLAALEPYRPESPHNVLLATSSGSGLPGLAFYGAAIALALIACGRRSGERPSIVVAAMMAAAVGHLVTDLFMTAEIAGGVLFWVILGVGIDRVAPTGEPETAAVQAASDEVGAA